MTPGFSPDRLGTIRDLVDNSGTVIDHVDYNAYGGVENETNPAAGDRLVGFAGLERSAATGLNLAFHRVQNPGAGIWLSGDPIGFAARDPNLRRYVGNNPIGKVDPLGLAPPALPPGATPLDLDITDPGNTIVFIGPDISDPRLPRSHQVLYPKYYQGRGVPPNHIYYFSNPAEFQAAVCNAQKLGLRKPHIILHTHGSSKGMYVGGSGSGRIGMYRDSDPQFWNGTPETGLFLDALASLDPGLVNFMACNLMNNPQGPPFKDVSRRRIGAPVYFSRGVFNYDGQHGPPFIYLTPGDNPDPKLPPSVRY